MVTNYMFEKIRTLSQEGKRISEIARLLKISRTTVRKHLRHNTAPQYKVRETGARQDSVAEFASEIKNWLSSSPQLTDQEIFELLIGKGYSGSIRTLNRRLKAFRPLKTKERFFEQKYTAAEQAQFDFKEELKLQFKDGLKTGHLLVGTLPYSDRFYIKAFPFKNYQCFIEGVHAFFEFIGGLTVNVRIDNLSPCVSKVLKHGERKYTKEFEKAIAYYHWGVLPCNPARGNEKGHVERDIQTYARRILNLIELEKPIFDGWDDLNRWLCEKIISKQKTTPLFAEEQAQLKPLPIRSEVILYKVEIMKPSPLGNLRVEGSSYSVPDAMIGRDCRVVLGAYSVIITLLKPHPSVTGLKVVHHRQERGCNRVCLEHVLPSLIRKPQAMIRWAHKDILFPNPVCIRFYGYLKTSLGSKAECDYLRTLNLIQNVSWPDLIASMELVLEAKPKDPYQQIRELLLKVRTPYSNTLCDWMKQKALNPELSTYDRFIPKGENHES